jgi:hypothetical protein
MKYVLLGYYVVVKFVGSGIYEQRRGGAETKLLSDQ